MDHFLSYFCVLLLIKAASFKPVLQVEYFEGIITIKWRENVSWLRITYPGGQYKDINPSSNVFHLPTHNQYGTYAFRIQLASGERSDRKLLPVVRPSTTSPIDSTTLVRPKLSSIATLTTAATTNAPPMTPTVTQERTPVAGKQHRLKCIPNEQIYYSKTIIWKVKGKKLNDSDERFRIDSNGSTLVINNIRKDDKNTVVQCSIKTANGQSRFSSKAFTLNPLYGPEKVNLNPANDSYALNEGEALQITCKADCNPSCNIEWTFKSKASPWQTGFTLRIPHVKEKNAGTYACTVRSTDYRFMPKKTYVQVNVKYGPKSVSLRSRGHIDHMNNIMFDKDKDSVFITCTADCNPTCNFTWVVPTGIVGTFTDQSINLGNAAQKHVGDYACIAANKYGSKTLNFKLFIQEYGIRLQNSKEYASSPLIVTEGSNLNLICQAKCHSTCSYTWESPSLPRFKNIASLTFDNIKKNATGNYTCYDRYLSRSRLTIEVIVLYQPVITSLGLKPDIVRKRNNYEVDEGESIAIECTVDSVPASNITWKKNNENVPIYTEHSIKNSIYLKNKANCQDAGTYICEAANGIGKANNSINVCVRCSPRESSTHSEMQNTVFEKEANDNVSFTISAYGYPPPVARWFYMYNITSSKRGITTTNKYRFATSGDKFSMHIVFIEEADFGIYVLDLSNEEGNITFNFTLRQPVILASGADSSGGNNVTFNLLVGTFTSFILFLVILAIFLVLIMKRRKQKKASNNIKTESKISTGKTTNQESNSFKTGSYKHYSYGTPHSSQHGEDKGKRKEDYVYAEVHKTLKGNKEFELQPASGEAGKQMDYTYAEVIKKAPQTEMKAMENKDEKVENAATPVIKKEENGELNYVDLDLQLLNKPGGRAVIHGAEDRTNYSTVDFTKHADPLPDSDKEDDQ